METRISAARPAAGYWIVTAISLLWNANGGYDYIMTRTRNTDYLSHMGNPQLILDYMDRFPLWAQAGWGLGVWASVLGSVLMLARSRHAAAAFILSLIGAVVSFGYQFFTAVPKELDTPLGKVMPLVIMGAVVLQWWYCRRAAARRVLR